MSEITRLVDHEPMLQERDAEDGSQPSDLVDSSDNLAISLSKLSEEKLNRFSKSILSSIMFGNGSAEEKILLRHVYWRAIGILARSRSRDQ
jgi:hypothetical protein